MRPLLLAAVLALPRLAAADAPAPDLPSAGTTTYGADRVRLDVPIGQQTPPGDGIRQEPMVRRGIYDRPYIFRLGSAATDVAIGGYFDFVGSYLQQQGVSDGFSFESRRFNIFITSKIADRIRLTSELEFEHGTQEISLETASVDILFHHTINLRAGVILAPIGKFNITHDSPLYDVIDRPLVSTQIIPATLSELGGGFFGAFYPGGHKLYYEAYVVNGLQAGVISADGTRIADGKEGNRFAADNNGQPGVTARLAYATPPRRFFQFDTGVSYYGGAYNTFKKAGIQVDDPRWLHIAAYDVDAIIGPVTVRGELAYAHIDLPPALPDKYAGNQFGFYGEAVGTFFKRRLLIFEHTSLAVVVRVDYVDLNLDRSVDTTWRLTAGLSFRPTPATSLRAGYYHEWITDQLGNQLNGAGLQIGIATYF